VIYLDACALIKFIQREAETEALRSWRSALPGNVELVTSALAELEITRTLIRARVEYQRVPFLVGEATRGIYIADVTSTVLARATGYRTANLGSLDAIHLATADPFQGDLTEFITYDRKLFQAAADLGFPVAAPR
jgi:uncharacterized protein